MPVTTLHPDYTLYSPQWKLTRDATRGDPAIKRDDSYLPAPFRTSDPERYEQYKARAYFVGVTGRTENAMIGMVFRKSPEYVLPPALEALLENLDGAGNSAEQLAKDAMAGLLETRRHLFLSDYPSAAKGLDAETESNLGLRPVIAQYSAEALINWRFETVAGQSKLVLAVLRERVNNSEDEFGHDYDWQYRVLRLRKITETDGVSFPRYLLAKEHYIYTQTVYDDSGDIITPEFTPRMAGGATFDHIPLHGVRQLETPPLYDIAKVNVAHYRNIADLEDAAYVVGQPMVHVDTGETSATEWVELNPSGIEFGSRKGVVTKGGGIELVQAAENNLIRQAKLDKENEMVMLGAQLIIRGGQAETAEAARIRAGAEASVLDMLTNDLSEDLEAAIEDMARFMGLPVDGVEYRLSTDFFEAGLNPQDLSAILQAKTLGVVARYDVRQMIRSGRIGIDPERTDEVIDEEVASEVLDG